MNEILIASLLTLIIFLIFWSIKFTKGFIVYSKIRKIIINTIYAYFKEVNIEYLNLDVLRKLIYIKLAKNSVEDRLEFVKLKWIEKGKFKLDYKLNIQDNYLVYTYSFDVKKMTKLKKIERGVHIE